MWNKLTPENTSSRFALKPRLSRPDGWNSTSAPRFRFHCRWLQLRDGLPRGSSATRVIITAYLLPPNLEPGRWARVSRTKSDGQIIEKDLDLLNASTERCFG